MRHRKRQTPYVRAVARKQDPTTASKTEACIYHDNWCSRHLYGCSAWEEHPVNTDLAREPIDRTPGHWLSQSQQVWRNRYTILREAMMHLAEHLAEAKLATASTTISAPLSNGCLPLGVDSNNDVCAKQNSVRLDCRKFMAHRRVNGLNNGTDTRNN